MAVVGMMGHGVVVILEAQIQEKTIMSEQRINLLSAQYTRWPVAHLMYHAPLKSFDAYRARKLSAAGECRETLPFCLCIPIVAAAILLWSVAGISSYCGNLN